MPGTHRRLILLRHGRTAWNAQRRFQGHADPPLDEVGRAQAWEVAGLIAAAGPDQLVSSTAIRAEQTAQIVAEVTGLAITLEPRFRERGLGHWEGLTLDEVAERFPDEHADWIVGRDVDRRGGETREQVAERTLAALRALPALPLTVIVTHGAAANAMCNALLGIEQGRHPLTGLANCHWSELAAETEPGAEPDWRMRGHNLGAPGTIVPLPMRQSSDDVSDADA